MNSKIMFFWGLIIVLICSSLIIINNLKQDKDLIRMERNLKNSTYSYIADKNLMPSYNETMVVSLEDLLENKYIKKSKFYEKYCVKGIKMTRRFIFNEYVVEKKCDPVMKNYE